MRDALAPSFSLLSRFLGPFDVSFRHGEQTARQIRQPLHW